MRRRLVAVAGIIVFAVVALTWWLKDAGHAVPPVTSASKNTTADRPVDASVVPAKKTTAASPAQKGADPATAPEEGAMPARRAQPFEDSPARIEAEAVALNLRHFGQRFGGNPVGTNAEIVKTLNGGNPQGVRYLPQEYLRLNAEGELLDHYGTPYFFHQNSATVMEVRSAGSDRILWTSDDIVVQ